FASRQVPQMLPPPPGLPAQVEKVKPKIEESNQRPKTMQRAGGFRAADDVEQRFRPVCIIKLERHSCDYQQEKAGDDQEVEEAFERDETREPLATDLGVCLGFAELPGIVPIEIASTAKPGHSMSSEESEHADQ